MKIKLDQNISRHAREALEAFKHDVDTVLDEGLSGSPDVEVLRAASALYLRHRFPGLEELPAQRS